ncbi:hypothetical protein C1646_766628 [Rhizophagus diaphanus]|nr:hypothetical protein C1646_766628 [Rhizophagus diaphanus] [Rhizophagus sp. MUCL 43196]
MSSSSAEIFAPLYNFLKTSSLDKITTSSDMENEINDDKRKQYLKSLQNINQKKDTPAHKHILMTISNIDINKISNDDPLCIGVINLSSEKYNIPESTNPLLYGEKANIRNLSKDVEVKKIYNVMHDQWIEDDHIKERIAGRITDILLQEIKLNALQRVSEGSENTLVEIIARLIDMTMYHLPVDYEVEVTRAERQSKTSKNRKIQQKTRSRGDKPDLMFRAYLFQLCLDSTKELVKKCTKETFYRNYIGFRINIAESVEEIEEFVYALLVLRNGVIVNLQSIVNSFQKKSRKTSDISPPPREAGRLSKKNSANF